MSSSLINDDGTIPSGLRIDIMRHCMENKKLLEDASHYKTYVGTGTKDENDVAITDSININNGYIQVPVEGGITNKFLVSNNFSTSHNYEFTVGRAVTSMESRQMSTLKGAKGILGDSSLFSHNIFTSHTSIVMWAALLRFANLRYLTVEISGNEEPSFYSYTYFVFNYDHTVDVKIINNRDFYIAAKEKGYYVYKIAKYDPNNLYFIKSSSGDADYEFLDVYSEYGLIHEIYLKFPSFNINTFKLGVFSSKFLDCDFIPLGYANVSEPNIGETNWVRFESMIFSEPVNTTSLSYYVSNIQRYIVELKVGLTGFARYTRFNHIYLVKDEAYTTKNLVASSSENAHYMILYKVIDANTTT